MIRSYCSMVTSATMAASAMPATLSTASSRPNSVTAVAIIRSTSASCATSHCTGTTPSPTAAAVSFCAPLMSAATTRAPSRTKISTDALPMPDPAPVMTATLPSNVPITNPPRCSVLTAPAPARTVRKNVRRSSVNRSGCSIAAKWPPRGRSAQCVTLYRRSTHGRGKRSTSFGYRVIPVGTPTYSARVVAVSECWRSQYRRIDDVIVCVTQ